MLPGALNRLIPPVTSLFWRTLCRVSYYGQAGSSAKLDSLEIISAATIRIIGLTKIAKIEFLLLDWIYHSIRIMMIVLVRAQNSQDLLSTISLRLKTFSLEPSFQHRSLDLVWSMNKHAHTSTLPKVNLLSRLQPVIAGSPIPSSRWLTRNAPGTHHDQYCNCQLLKFLRIEQKITKISISHHEIFSVNL